MSSNSQSGSEKPHHFLPRDERLLAVLDAWNAGTISRSVLTTAIRQWAVELPVPPPHRIRTSQLVAEPLTHDQFASLVAKLVDKSSRNGDAIRSCFAEVARSREITTSAASDEHSTHDVWQTCGVESPVDTFGQRYRFYTPPVESTGEAEIFKAEDPRTLSLELKSAGIPESVEAQKPRLVALKRPKRELLRDVLASRSARSKLLREACRAAIFEHPNIVPVHDIYPGGTGDAPFYTMRFLPEGTLADTLVQFRQRQTSGAVTANDWREIVDHVIEAAAGIAYAHEMGYAHLDLKPTNIAVSENKGTQVLDWGQSSRIQGDVAVERRVDDSVLAPPLNSENVTQPNFGTPAYAAPEQWRGESCSPRTDVFQLGAILYEILSGRPPYRDGSEFGRLCALLGAVPELDELAHPLGLPDFLYVRLLAICQKAMNPRPENRYATVDALRKDLLDWRTDNPVSVYDETFQTKFGRLWRKQRQTILSATILVCGLAVIALIASLYAAVALKESQQMSNTLREKTTALAGINSEYELRGRELDRSRIALQETQDAVAKARASVAAATVDAQLAREQADISRQEAAKAKIDIDIARSQAIADAMRSATILFREGLDVSDSERAIRKLLDGNGENVSRLRQSFAVAYIRRIGGERTETRLEGHRGPVIALWYSADGSEIRSASADGTIRIWNPASAKVIKTLPIIYSNAPGEVGIRIETESQTGKHRIAEILPESPASEFMPALAVGDEVLAAGPSESELKSTANLKEIEVVGLIRGNSGTDVVLRSRNSSGVDQMVTLKRRPMASPYKPGLLNKFSPDGRWLGVTVAKKQVAIVDALTGLILHVTPPVAGSLAAFDFSSDGSRYVWGVLNQDRPFAGQLTISNTMTGQPEKVLPHSSPLNGAAFDPLEQRLYASWGSDSQPLGSLDLSKPSTSPDLFEERGMTQGKGIRMAISPSGKWLFHGGNGRVPHGPGTDVIYDVKHRRAVSTANLATAAVAFDSSETLVALGEIAGELQIRQVENDRPLRIRRGMNCEALAFAPDARTLAIGTDKEIVLWRFQEDDGQETTSLVNGPSSITAAHRDASRGDLLVARHKVVLPGTYGAPLLEVYPGKAGHRVNRWPPVSTVAVSPRLSDDGQTAVIARYPLALDEAATIETIDLRDGTSRKIATRATVPIPSLTRDGRMYVSDHRSQHFFHSLALGETRWNHPLAKPEQGSLNTDSLRPGMNRIAISRLAIDAEGKTVVGFGDRTVLLEPDTLNVRAGMPIDVDPGATPALSPDGRWMSILTTNTSNPRSQLVRMDDCRMIPLSPNHSMMTEGTFSQDGKTLLVIDSLNQKLFLYRMPDHDNGAKISELSPHKERDFTGIMLSPVSHSDSRSFFSWSSPTPLLAIGVTFEIKGEMIELSAETGEIVRTLGAQPGLTTLSSVSRDGRLFVAMTTTGHLSRWRLDRDLPVDTRRSETILTEQRDDHFKQNIQSLAISPDGERLVLAIDSVEGAKQDGLGGHIVQVWNYPQRQLLGRGRPAPGVVEEIVFLDHRGTEAALRGQRKAKSGSNFLVRPATEKPRTGFAEVWDCERIERQREIVTPPLYNEGLTSNSRQFSAILPNARLAVFLVQGDQTSLPQVRIWNLSDGEAKGALKTTVFEDMPCRLVSLRSDRGESLAVQLIGCRDEQFLEAVRRIQAQKGAGQLSPAERDAMTNSSMSRFQKTKGVVIQTWDAGSLANIIEESVPFREDLFRDLSWKNSFDIFTVSSDGSELAGVTKGNDLFVYDIPTGERLLALPPVGGSPLHLSFSRDRKSLAVVTAEEATHFTISDLTSSPQE